MPEIGDILFVLGMAALAFWRREIPFYIIASIVCFFIGARWLDSALQYGSGWEYGVGAIGIAVFCIYRAVMQAISVSGLILSAV